MRETNPMLAAIDCPPLTDSDRARARRTAAEYATGADDLRMLLDMLDLLGPNPQPPASKPQATTAPPAVVKDRGTCTECGVATYSRRAHKGVTGGRRYGARGLCETCYMAVRRTERPAPESRMVDSTRTLDRLQQWKDAGFTFRQVADATGLSAATMSRLLSDRPPLIRATTEAQVLTAQLHEMAVQ